MSDNASKQPCLMVMAGGTGGHVFPGLAVAEHLRAQGWRVHWLGTAERMEARLVPQHQIPISFLQVSGLRGNGLVRMLKAPFQIIAAIVQACRVMRDVKPDVVLGMGGYASGPGGIAARLCGKPLVLHEQNAVAGMTNRLLSRLANRVMVAFPQALASHPRREVIGNPVRQQLFELPDPRQRISPADQPLKVLVVGGSLGARILNQTLPEAIAQAIDQAPLALWHQTGKGNRDTVAGAYAGNALQPTELRVDEFIDDMPAALAWADLVICRAGALTVSELAAIGLGAILVPLPHAVDDHQTANARTLSDHQAGILMPQTQLSAQHLAAELVRLAGDREQLIDMAQAARSQAKPDATRAVAETCAKLARK